MNITLSVQELRAYEHSVRAWNDRRAEFIKNCLFGRKHLASALGRWDAKDEELSRSELAKWDEQNPMPKLIPSV